jgi:hypothetical protein
VLTVQITFRRDPALDPNRLILSSRFFLRTSVATSFATVNRGKISDVENSGIAGEEPEA